MVYLTKLQIARTCRHIFLRMNEIIKVVDSVAVVTEVTTDTKRLSVFLSENGLDVKKLRDLLQEYLIDNSNVPDDEDYFASLEAWYKRQNIEEFLKELG